MKLNLGSGNWPLDGYINIDRATGGEVYPIKPGTDLPEVDQLIGVLPGSADEIRASHILEHFSHRQTMDVLKEWVRVLKPGGIIKIAVPDFDWICRQHVKELDVPGTQGENVTGYLMGGQTDENDFHKAIFNEAGLRKGMAAAGLVDVERWTSEVEDCASLPVSLNLQGRKPGVGYINEEAEAALHAAVDRWESAEPDRIRAVVDDQAALAADKPRETPDAPTEGADAPEPHVFEWLRPRAYNKYSQWGEDGLLDAIFERIGTTNRYVVECGAGHPIQGSNSRKLIEGGWRALLVEPDEKACRFLFDEYGDRHERVVISGATVGARTDLPKYRTGMDDLLSTLGAPDDPDLLVIDVDGQDWYIWNGLLNHRPRVVVIEFGHDSPPDFVPEENGPGQAGRGAIERLAWSKGYETVVITGHNFICVDRTLLDKLTTGADEYQDEPVVPDGKILFVPQEIGAMMSCPRLGFMDNMFSCYALAATGIHLERGGGCFWDQGLTRMMQNALDVDRKYLLTLDYDSVFTAQDVIELYRIMASPGGEGIDALAAMQIRREKEGVLLTIADADGKNRSLISRDELNATVLPVRTAHFGLTLIRADALRKMPKPWFQAVPDENGEWGDGRRDSDISYWEKWRECGNSLFMACRVPIGHTEQVIAWPNDELKTFRQAMTDYQENGKPPEAWK